MSLGVTGHGALMAMELDPVGSPGTFTTIAELNTDITGLAVSRPYDNVTPHNDTIDSHVSAGYIMREPLTLTVNYVYGDTTHQGLLDAHLDKTRTGFRFRGPGWATPGTDEIICSGEVVSWTQVNPVREGVRSAEVTIVMSKQMIVNGTQYGSAA